MGKSQHGVIAVIVWAFEMVLRFPKVHELYFWTASLVIYEYKMQTLDQRNLALPSSGF